jgi:hypothetical protein
MLGPSAGMGKVAGSAGRQDVVYPESIEIEGISLDTFVFEGSNPIPQLVKMDIEGGEVLALPGMARLLSEARPLVFLELHGPQASAAAWQVFKDLDYRVCRMVPGYPKISAPGELDWKAYLVAVPSGVALVENESVDDVK